MLLLFLFYNRYVVPMPVRDGFCLTSNRHLSVTLKEFRILLQTLRLKKNIVLFEHFCVFDLFIVTIVSVRRHLGKSEIASNHSPQQDGCGVRETAGDEQCPNSFPATVLWLYCLRSGTAFIVLLFSQRQIGNMST